MSEAISGIYLSTSNPACRCAHAGYGLLDRDIGRLGAVQNLVDDFGDATQVRFRGKADRNRQARLVGSVENDPQRSLAGRKSCTAASP